MNTARCHKFSGSSKHGFTLMELMIVVGIISVFTIAALTGFANAIQRAKIAQALSDIQEIRQAIEQYHADMGFYPPDTPRAVDPGLAAIPSPPIDCTTQCPGGYNPALITAKWKGPYLDEGLNQRLTPWGGHYDYQYFRVATTRSGCQMAPGVYIGLEAFNTGFVDRIITGFSEQYFIDKGLDADGAGCDVPNGEVQFLIKRL